MAQIQQEHILLLRELAEFLHLEVNFGYVPEFEAKRPFGNSNKYRVSKDACEAMYDECPDECEDNECAGSLEHLRECTPVLRHILKSEILEMYVGQEMEDWDR